MLYLKAEKGKANFIRLMHVSFRWCMFAIVCCH